ncbi:MAG: metallophosphatase [Phycisphaerae bacterium]|nr:metallophosphatase [Phycisphaerae bacterium]
MDGRRAKRIRSGVLSAVMLAVGVAFFVLAAHRPPAVTSAADAAAAPVKVTILHTNDSHGQLEGLSTGGRQIGGAGRLATAVKRVRQVRQARQAARVLLVDCGDVFSRGDELTRRTVGAANVAVMNRLRYDLWVLGNGEFYSGLDVLRRRMAEADFPVLAANVTVDGEALAKPYIIERAGPARIAFLGLCTVREESQENLGVDEADAIETARGLVPALRQQADVVVAVTHLGLPQDVRLAGAVEGIDLILGGHSHTVLQHGFRANAPTERQVLVCQAGDKYRYLGQVDLELSPKAAGGGFQVANITAKLIPLDESVQPDPATDVLLTELKRASAPPPPPSSAPASQAASQPTAQPAWSPATQSANAAKAAIGWPAAKPPALVPLAR